MSEVAEGPTGRSEEGSTVHAGIDALGQLFVNGDTHVLSIG